MRFTLQRAAGRARSSRRDLAALGCGAACGFRALFGRLLRARRRTSELDAGAPRFRESDRNRLFGRAGAVLAFADVVNLLAHELARLRRSRLASALVGA